MIAFMTQSADPRQFFILLSLLESNLQSPSLSFHCVEKGERAGPSTCWVNALSLSKTPNPAQWFCVMENPQEPCY